MALTYSWETVSAAQCDADSPLDEILMEAMRRRDILLYEWIGKNYTPAEDHDHNAVNSKAISASISQGSLKSTTGEVCLSLPSSTPEGSSNFTLPGGEFGFSPRLKTTGENQNHITYLKSSFLDQGSAIGGDYLTTVYLYISHTTGYGDNHNFYAQQRYIEASRPYEPYRKNDIVPLFVFAVMDKASGKVVSTYVALDPPWANNGPTVINPLGQIQRIKKQKSGVNMADLKTGKTKPEDFGFLLENFEEPTKEEIKQALAIPITQEEKNADMPLIPHPFLSFDPAKQQVVVISPTDNKFCIGLSRLHEMGESVAEIIHGDYLVIDNTPISGLVTPESVMAVNGKWK